MNEILDLYKESLNNSYNVSIRYLHNFSIEELNIRHKHLIWMLDEIPKIEDEGKRNRWLGFIQGYFWTLGVFTIDELREHSRKILASKS